MLLRLHVQNLQILQKYRCGEGYLLFIREEPSGVLFAGVEPEPMRAFCKDRDDSAKVRQIFIQQETDSSSGADGIPLPSDSGGA